MIIDSNKVVVVGAGPVGIAHAVILKAICPDCEITVIDGRPAPKRNHGLKIKTDSVNIVREVLNLALKDQTDSLIKERIHLSKNTFFEWKESFVRTSKIEIEIAKIAQDFGITVYRDKACKISMENPFSSSEKIQKIMQDAQVIIGADGAHSVVREIINSPLTDQKTLQYLIELKYQTDGKAIPRSYAEAFIESAWCGHIDIETMHRAASEENKPVTLHTFVDRETYEAFREEDESGNLKGVFGNSWTLAEIKEKTRNNENIKKIYGIFKTHLKGISKRGGCCHEEKISTLEMTIYRSEKSVEFYQGKIVALIGDADSGMILERGFNKGLMEAALCAQAVADYFKQLPSPLEKGMPAVFLDYQAKTKELFEKERASAEIKNKGINTGRVILASSHRSIEGSSNMTHASSDSSSSINHYFSSLFGSSKSSNEN